MEEDFADELEALRIMFACIAELLPDPHSLSRMTMSKSLLTGASAS